MADVNAEIGVNINTSNALAQLKALQREIARFHASVAKSSEAAALAQRDLQKNFLNGINAVQGFSAELRTVKTTAEGFTDSLERNKFSMREYFRYSMASTKTFGRLFKSELDTVNKVAEEGVKRLQTQYIKMGRDANGAMKAIAVMPTKLNLNDFATQTQLAAQKQAIFNQLMKQGSTNLLNFGKNTQWAGRQLMVGFTIPLIGLGTAASRTFMDMETAAIKFKKVYGDLFTATEERNQALKDIEELGSRFTKYGIALADTVGLAAEAAAAGFKGIDLQRQVTEATRLQVLGQIDQQKALETTISLQNAFRLSSADLAESINFLNAVENQTVVSLDDITTAIPKAAPIVRELGGDVKDLAFFMAAMKEGGINASEGANALKSGLASLINPSDKARAMLSDFGIDIDAIVNKNAGNVKQTVVDFAVALDDLSSLSRQRAIEQLFGKFQQARLSALFDNVIRDGNQASRVLDLAGTSTEELAALAEQELGITANSSMNKFRKSVEDLKAALVPVGQLFLEIVTPFLENIGNLLDKFNDLSAGTKRVIGILTIGLGAIAPVVLMTVGLFANFVANGIKGLMLLRNGYLRLTGQSQILSEQTNFLTVEQQQALAAAASLEQSHMRLQQVFTGEAASVRALIAEYQRMIAAQNMAATRFPGMMIPGFKPQGYIDGVVSVPGPKGAGDVVPAMLSPGEAVISAEMNKKYAPLVQGIIADRIPGYANSIGSVAERVISSGIRKGSGPSVFVPGSYEQAHFGGTRQMSRQDLTTFAEGLNAKAQTMILNLINKSENALVGFFEVLDNRVVSLSHEVNSAIGETGSGRTVLTALARRDLVDSGAIAHPQLQREMKKAGASVEQIDQTVLDITNEISVGFDELGNITEVTAEQIDQIVAEAYQRVSETNDMARTAYQNMQNPTTITDPSQRGGRAARLPIPGQQSYKQQRDANTTEMTRTAERKNIAMPYGTIAQFNITEEMAQSIGASQAEIQRAFKLLSDDAKQRLALLKGDIQQFGPALLQALAEESIQIEAAGQQMGEGIIDGIARGTQAASPSQAARRQGQNVADGFEQGLLEGMDDVSMAGQKLGDAATQGIGLSDLTTNVRYTQGTLPGLNVSGSVENLTESLDDLDIATTQAATSASNSSANLAKWNSRLMSTSFALSSISGIAMAFGNNFGGLGDKVFKVSSAMFALQGVVQLLTQAKLLELAATRLAAAKQAAAFATYGAGIASRAGMVGMLGRIGVFAKTLLGLTNPIGWVITTLTVGVGLYKIINNRLEANRKKIDGLGDAALIAGKKLETLEQFFGTDFRRFAFEGFKYDENTTAAQGLVAGRRQRAEDLIANKDFQKDYKDTIDALRNATTSEAQLVLEGISMQLQARGATTEQIQTVTDALIKEAGKTEVVLNFAKIDIKTKEGQAELKKNVDQLLKGYNKAFAKGINDSYRKTLNLAGKNITGVFGTLQLQLEDGSLSAKEYAAQVANINTQILAMPDSQAKLNLVNAVFDAMGEDAAKAAAGVTNLNNKLLLAQAIMLGVADAQSIKNLSSPLFFVQDAGVKTLTANINKYIKQLTSGIEELNKGTDDNNNGNGKGITLQEKLIKIYQDQVKGLEKKLKALRDVNDEIDRQNEFMKDQVALDKQITEAKISGNYLEAAALSQQKLYNQAEFNRETQEIEIQKQIDSINERISYLEDKGKKSQLTAAEKKLLKIEAKGKGAGTNKDNKKDPGSNKGNGASAGDLGTGATSEKNETGKKDLTGTRNISSPSKETLESWNRRRRKFGPENVKLVFNTTTGKWEVLSTEQVKSNHIDYSKWQSGQKRYASGGLIKGPGTGTSDSIFAMVDQYKSGGMIRVSNGEYIFSKKAIDNAGGPKAIDALHQRLRNTPKFKDGGVANPYNKKGKPTGSPYGPRWGELIRDIHGLAYGRDIWGGTEIPGLKFRGKHPNHSDYWHQMQEQPRKPSGGGGLGSVTIPIDSPLYGGSGASGGFGGGSGGFGLFHSYADGGHVKRTRPSALKFVKLLAERYSETKPENFWKPAGGGMLPIMPGIGAGGGDLGLKLYHAGGLVTSLDQVPFTFKNPFTSKTGKTKTKGSGAGQNKLPLSQIFGTGKPVQDYSPYGYIDMGDEYSAGGTDQKRLPKGSAVRSVQDYVHALMAIANTYYGAKYQKLFKRLGVTNLKTSGVDVLGLMNPADVAENSGVAFTKPTDAESSRNILLNPYSILADATGFLPGVNTKGMTTQANEDGSFNIGSMGEFYFSPGDTNKLDAKEYEKWIASNTFNTPRGKMNLIMVAFHEFAHGLMSKVQAGIRDKISNLTKSKLIYPESIVPDWKENLGLKYNHEYMADDFAGAMFNELSSKGFITGISNEYTNYLKNFAIKNKNADTGGFSSVGHPLNWDFRAKTFAENLLPTDKDTTTSIIARMLDLSGINNLAGKKLVPKNLMEDPNAATNLIKNIMSGKAKGSSFYTRVEDTSWFGDPLSYAEYTDEFGIPAGRILGTKTPGLFASLFNSIAGFIETNKQHQNEWGRPISMPKKAMGGYVNMASLPKFKNGIENVPYDMPAIIHKNERVLTEKENKAYGQNNSTINATFNIAGGNSDEIVNKVMVKLNTLTNKNNKSNKVAI